MIPQLLVLSDAFYISNQKTLRFVMKKQMRSLRNAKIDETKKHIVLTYTDYVEKHSDTSGSFFVYTQWISKAPTKKGEIPISYY